MTSPSKVDVVIIGGGIAGASAAWALSEHVSVALVEQAPSAGYHATGRSASVLSETSGHAAVCVLAAASRGFFESPPVGFVEHALLSPRGLLWVGRAADAGALDHLVERARSVAPTVRRLTPAETLTLIPHFKPGAVAGGATFEPDAMAIDTDALLQGYVRGLRLRGGLMFTSTAAVELSPTGGGWSVVCDGRTFYTPAVVNAAGAWGDVVAARAGVAPIGLEPRRRTACLAVLADVDPTWPLVMDVAGRYYAEPESGGLLVSPADESPSEPCDAQAEELDVALALDRLREATTLPLRSVRRAWAGLRTFSRDGAPVVGEDPAAPGFFWLVGQAGAGIKTAPAMASSVAALVRGESAPTTLADQAVGELDLSPARFR